MKVIDNFLPDVYFNHLQKTLSETNFPWYYNDTITGLKKDTSSFQFTHNFYKDHTIVSSFWPIITPLIEKLKVCALVRVKANLLPRSTTHQSSCLHEDHHSKGVHTALFYCNTNNGYTFFKDNKKVLSKANTVILFNSNKLHAGTSCTDQKTRLVINVVYYP